MVDEDNAIWDVTDNDLFSAMNLGRQGYLEKLGYSVVNKDKVRPDSTINDVLMGSGLITEPLELVRNGLGVVIGMVHYMLPIAVLSLFASMEGYRACLCRRHARTGCGLPRILLACFLAALHAWTGRRRPVGLHFLVGFLRDPGDPRWRKDAHDRRVMSAFGFSRSCAGIRERCWLWFFWLRPYCS